MESLALRECLLAGPEGIAKRFFRQASQIIVSRGESEIRLESITKLIEETSALAIVGAKGQGV